MKYHKHIDIDNFKVIQQKTLDFISSKNNVDRIGFYWMPWKEYTEYCPEILTSFSRYGLTPTGAATITTAKFEHSIVHVDAVQHECRINIPILNCEGSMTEFYSGGEYDIKYTPGEKNPYMILKKDSIATKVDEVELNQPTVIKVLQPHYVRTNLQATPRISLSVQFDIDPVFLLD